MNEAIKHLGPRPDKEIIQELRKRRIKLEKEIDDLTSEMVELDPRSEKYRNLRAQIGRLQRQFDWEFIHDEYASEHGDKILFDRHKRKSKWVDNSEKVEETMRAKTINEMSLYKGKNIGYKADSQLESAESIKFHISKRPNGKYFSDPVMKKHVKEDLFWCIEGTREAKEIDYKIPLWSVAAMEQVNRTGSEKNLRLEHAYPRNLLVTYLLDNRDDLTVEEIADLLDLYIHGIVVTLKEDNELLGGPLKTNLPKDLDPSLDPKSMDYIFSRYTTKKIDVLKVRTKKEGKVTKLEPIGYFIKDGKIVI